MYTIEKKFLIKLGGTGDPAASQSVEIPLHIDEMSQNMAVWLYTPAGIALGGGSLVVKRNGEIVSTTAFAGNSIVAPVGIHTVGADFEMGLQPATTSRRAMAAVWHYDPVSGVMIEDKDLAKWDTAPRAMPTTFTVVNTDVAKKDLVLMWTALVWRNA